MASRDQMNWMLAEAMNALARAERMHKQLFQIQSGGAAREPRWEPPVDVFETENELLVLVALPGVDPDQAEAVVEDGTLIISGRRTFPSELRHAVIHRLELPQGRFERRISLPPGRYAVRRYATNGCLALSLGKVK